MSTVPTPASPRIPPTVWILGVVSLLMDVSSEMISTLLPLFLVSGLGLSALAVGLIEGASASIALATRMLSGMLSDRLRHRKWLAVLGYGLAAVSRPMFPMADGALGILGGKFIDRVGKGIRGAPRDALIADVTPPELRGRSFGLRKSLDTVGGFIGPLIAIALMLATANDYRTVFWLAAIPAVLAVVLLIVGIREPETPSTLRSKPLLKWRETLRLDGPTWGVIGVAGVLALARFSEAFLLLRANDAGVPVAWVPLVIVFMHLIYGALAYPVGVLSDRVGRMRMLIISLGFLIAADLVLAQADSLPWLLVGVALWGAHMGFSQGILATMIADRAPAALRGTAFGLLSVISALAILVGNGLAGGLWTVFGPAATFYTGAGLAALAGLLLIWRHRANPH